MEESNNNKTFIVKLEWRLYMLLLCISYFYIYFFEWSLFFSFLFLHLSRTRKYSSSFFSTYVKIQSCNRINLLNSFFLDFYLFFSFFLLFCFFSEDFIEFFIHTYIIAAYIFLFRLYHFVWCVYVIEIHIFILTELRESPMNLMSIGMSFIILLKILNLMWFNAFLRIFLHRLSSLIFWT